VDGRKVPTVTLEQYLGGDKPKVSNLQTVANKKIIQEHLAQQAS
jgi:hypothetical protein